MNRIAYAWVVVALASAPARAEEPVVPEPPPAGEPAVPTDAPVAGAVAVPVIAPQPAVVAAPAGIDLADHATRPAFAARSTARLALDLELYSSARYVTRAGTNLSELRLDRGELGARIALGPQAAAELRIEAIRSALEGGALGIDGDSTVVRVKYANISGTATLGPVRLDGALGFVADPWIRTLEDGYTIKPLSRTGSERLLGWPTSDLSALVRGAIGPARLTVVVGNGEGLRYPERNTGKTTTAVLEVVALHARDARLSIAAVGRDGSVGVGSVRDRRAGGGATLVTPWVRGGVEVVQAWGIGDQGGAEGLELGGWVDGRIVERVHVTARGASLGFSDGGRQTTFGGALAVEPWRATAPVEGRFRIWLALDRVTSSGGAMPVLGADPGNATIVMLVVSALAPFALD